MAKMCKNRERNTAREWARGKRLRPRVTNSLIRLFCAFVSKSFCWPAQTRVQHVLCVCVYMYVCVSVCEFCADLAQMIVRDKLWKLGWRTLCPLAHPFASLSIGYGNYAPFGLSPAAFPLHAAAFLEACTACHAMPREQHQGRSSSSPIVVLFVCFRFPPA